jgi:hypothetical protein
MIATIFGISLVSPLILSSPQVFPSHNWPVDDDEESEEEKLQKKHGKPGKYIESSDEEENVVELSDSDSDTQEFSMLSFTRAGMEQAAAKAKAKGKGKALAKKPIKQAWGKSLLPQQRRGAGDVQDILQPRPQPKMLERFIPSTKMKWVMNQLKEWQKSHPSDKVSMVWPTPMYHDDL